MQEDGEFGMGHGSGGAEEVREVLQRGFQELLDQGVVDIIARGAGPLAGQVAEAVTLFASGDRRSAALGALLCLDLLGAIVSEPVFVEDIRGMVALAEMDLDRALGIVTRLRDGAQRAVEELERLKGERFG